MAIAKDKFEQASTKFQIYSDFLNDLTPHPVVKDIVRYTNEAAISRSIRNLIMTNKGERLYQPALGSDINKLLFEPMNTATADMISQFVRDTIKYHEPRALVLDVQVITREEYNAYQVNIFYRTINRQDPIQLTVNLSRVR